MFLACVAIQGYTEYFVVWRNDPKVREAFGERFLSQAYAIRAALNESPTWIVVHDLGISDEFYLAQPVMFLTDTEANQNVHYVREGTESQIPPDSQVFHIK